MNILITNLGVSGNSGTELYVKELAIELKSRGHNIEIYTLFLGNPFIELIIENINVVNSLNLLKYKPDIIHSHHNILTYKVTSYFKYTPVIFFIHDRISSLDHPFLHENIIKYIAVDLNCRERYLTESDLKENDIDIIFNWYNPKRFVIKDEFNLIPKKALLFSNYINKGKIYDEINAACQFLNIELDIIGMKSGYQHNKPELILKNYDIVFAKAKAGIEALATANALIVCDFTGLGGMVTPENVEHFKNFNFGMKLMSKPINKDLIITEIKKYKVSDIEYVSKYIRSTSNFYDIVSEIESAYNNAIREFNINKRGVRKGNFFNLIYIVFIYYKVRFIFYLNKNKTVYNLVMKTYHFIKNI
jgi:hypothetical protein